MAICDVRFTWRQRKRVHLSLIAAISASATIGLTLFLLGIFASHSLGRNLPPADRIALDRVFMVVRVYGLYVLLHNLLGAKLCYNYFRYAEGSGMNLRLFLWTTLGLLAASVGCFMASLCVSTAEHLVSHIRRSLFQGMKQYLTDATWKRTIDRMQIGMQCCGVDTFNDWHKTYWLRRELLLLDSPSVLRYAELDGRVMPPVVPWSCCRVDVKGPCYHDPLQLPNPEHDSTYESLNTRGCLAVLKGTVVGALYSVIVLIALLFILQVGVTLLSRYDFTAARNAVALGSRRGPSPGWLYGRLDFGNAAGPNLCQIYRKNSGRGDPMIDLKPLVCTSDTE